MSQNDFSIYYTLEELQAIDECNARMEYLMSKNRTPDEDAELDAILDDSDYIETTPEFDMDGCHFK